MPRDPADTAAAHCPGSTDHYTGIFGFHTPSVLYLVFHERETQVFVEDISLRQSDGAFQIHGRLDLDAWFAVGTLRNTGFDWRFEMLVQRRKSLTQQGAARLPVVGSEETCGGMQRKHRQRVIAAELEFLA